jgi:hypothetical protein
MVNINSAEFLSDVAKELNMENETSATKILLAYVKIQHSIEELKNQIER